MRDYNSNVRFFSCKSLSLLLSVRYSNEIAIGNALQTMAGCANLLVNLARKSSGLVARTRLQKDCVHLKATANAARVVRAEYAVVIKGVSAQK
jgi:hypothetical protein